MTDHRVLESGGIDESHRTAEVCKIPGPQHHSDVKSGVVAVMGLPEQTGAVNMTPTTRKLAGIMG